MKHVMLSAALLLILLASAASAGELARIDKMESGDLRMVGFEVTKPAEVHIDAVGLKTRFSGKLVAYAWIIDAASREPVWVMKGSRSKKHQNGGMLRVANRDIMLNTGKYELYMYAGNMWNISINLGGGKDIISFLGDIFDEEDNDDEFMTDPEELLEDCYVAMSSTELTNDQFQTYTPTGTLPSALVAHNQMGDDQYVRQGFELDKPMNVRIYSVIEHPQGYDSPVDGGWIVNVATREKVWQMDRWNTERAGGGRKNRVFDDEVRLPEGKYVLHFTTDGSHSYETYNSSPPYDPLNWGVTLLPGTDFDGAAFHLIDDEGRGKPLVDLSRVGDNDYVEQAFEVKKKSEFIVHAVGEMGSDGFVDNGWIQFANNSGTVFEMTKKNTEHAGGADKNRSFEGTITLKPGKYLAAFETDGSHAYRDWNSSKPYEPRAWGLCIYPVEGFIKANLALLDEADVIDDSDILARLVRMRDNRERSNSFSLDKDTRIRIYALGEGSGGDMHDYGWIENAKTGRVIWEMTYRKTDRAGGADKNRRFDDTIMLEAGDYEVFFVTDGSHSYNDWNARRPRDGKNWGITISIPGDDYAGN